MSHDTQRRTTAVYAPTDPTRHEHHNTLANLRADLNQLRNPIPRPPARQRVRTTSGRRITQWRELSPLPPLLDQLRQATQPGGGMVRGPERRRIPDTQPPGNLDAMVLLSAVYVGISGWHSGLSLPSPPRDADWQRHALRQLHDEARRLSPQTVTALADDVHNWWRWAASASGITSHDLTALRQA